MARLKALPWGKALGALDPCREAWTQMDKGTRFHLVALASTPSILESQLHASVLRSASEPPQKKVKKKAKCPQQNRPAQLLTSCRLPLEPVISLTALLPSSGLSILPILSSTVDLPSELSLDTCQRATHNVTPKTRPPLHRTSVSPTDRVTTSDCLANSAVEVFTRKVEQVITASHKSYDYKWKDLYTGIMKGLRPTII